MKNPYHPSLPDGFTEQYLSVADMPDRPVMSEQYEKGLVAFVDEMKKVSDNYEWDWQDYLTNELLKNWRSGMFDAKQLWQTSERVAAKKLRHWYSKGN